MFRYLILCFILFNLGNLGAQIETRDFSLALKNKSGYLELFCEPIDKNGVPGFQPGVTYEWHIYNRNDSFLASMQSPYLSFNMNSYMNQELRICMYAWVVSDSAGMNLKVCKVLWADSLSVYNKNYKNTIVIYDDKNSNCKKESTENTIRLPVKLSNKNISYCTDGWLSDSTILYMDSGVYNINLLHQDAVLMCTSAYIKSDSNSENIVQFIPAKIDTTGKHFGITIFQNSAWRPGDTSTLGVQFQNMGLTSATDSFIITFPDSVFLLDADPSPIKSKSGSAEWKMTLTSWEIQNANLYFLPSQYSYTIKDAVIIKVNCIPGSKETDSLDNFQEIKIALNGSFDPNEKQVFGKYPDNSNQPIEYVIHFQNTGTGPAKKVLIRDTLPNQADPASLGILASSHKCRMLSREGVVEFLFDPIFLPDSGEDFNGSQGFVRFAVMMRKNNGNGAKEKITNTASIYFDYNTPIKTNEAIILAAVGTLGTNAILKNEKNLVVFPNPGTGNISIRNSGKLESFHFSMKTISGAEIPIHSISKNNGEIELNIPENTKSGVYLIFMNGEFIARWIKI